MVYAAELGASCSEENMPIYFRDDLGFQRMCLADPCSRLGSLADHASRDVGSHEDVRAMVEYMQKTPALSSRLVCQA